MQQVYIAGAGMTRFGKLPGSLEEIMAKAASAALEDAGREKIDAVYLGSVNPGKFSSMASVITDKLRLTPVPASRISSGAVAFDEAVFAVASGYFDSVLAVAGEKSRYTAEVLGEEERKYGVSMAALAAMATRRYMHSYGMKEEDFAEVAVKNHLNARSHPLARFNKKITVREVMNSKVISTPLKLYDCSPVSDGAAAIVLTRAKQKVRLKGMGYGSDHISAGRRDSLTSFKSTRRAAEMAYRSAGITPGDVSFAELHDAFTPFEIIGSEDVGLFPPGRGWIALKEGITSRSGRIPVNPTGGLNARGHPGGASGLAQIVEAVWQLRGQAADRQLEKELKYALTQTAGGFATNNLVIILEKLK